MSKISNTDRNRVRFAAKNRGRRHRRDVLRTPVTTHRPGEPSVFAAMAAAAKDARMWQEHVASGEHEHQLAIQQFNAEGLES